MKWNGINTTATATATTPITTYYASLDAPPPPKEAKGTTILYLVYLYDVIYILNVLCLINKLNE